MAGSYRGRTCCVCGGLTAALSNNNFICSKCWKAYCVPGVPPWVKFLRNQQGYESRQSLEERRRYSPEGYPYVRVFDKRASVQTYGVEGCRGYRWDGAAWIND
jgi:hypothetical protein